MQVNRYKPAAEIEGVDLMKVGVILAVMVIIGFAVATLVFVLPNISFSGPNDATAYAVKIDKPMFVDVDGDKDIDLLLPGGYIVYNNPQPLPPTK